MRQGVLLSLVSVGLLTTGCKRQADDAVTVGSVSAVAPAVAAEPTALPGLAAARPSVPGATAPPPPTPADLYASCEQRVELPQSDEECASDDDCGAGGASGEICTTAAAVPELMSTAENRMCFAVLDTCGCNEGRCTWSLLDSLPTGSAPPGGPLMLPPTKGMLPPTAPSEPSDEPKPE